MTKQLMAEATGEIQAPAEKVYAILADYRQHHPHVLPAAYFTALVVEEGGVGAGTVFRAEMNVYGSKRAFRMRVAEPKPGRVLSETDLATGLLTTFAVTSADANRCTVTITTIWQAAPGLAGWLQGVTLPAFMRRIYHAELRQLDVYAQTLAL